MPWRAPSLIEGVRDLAASDALMPVVFFGHGSPMNAILDNVHTRAWNELGACLPPPRAILSISAHWLTRGSAVTAIEHPPTIHDFGGFPDALFAVRYPAPGAPALARRVSAALAPRPVVLDTDWGLDHGTWSVLVHAYPKADVPVVQLSIDIRSSPAELVELGRALAPLRREGVLVMASGNVVHNLRAMRWQDPAPAYDWALRFENWVRQALEDRDFDALVAYETKGPEARLAVPTPEHYLPLLYCLGLTEEGDAISFPTQGVFGASISMLSVVIGAR